MGRSHTYDPKKKVISTHYVNMVCRKCGFVMHGAGCIYLPEALKHTFELYPPKK